MGDARGKPYDDTLSLCLHLILECFEEARFLLLLFGLNVMMRD